MRPLPRVWAGNDLLPHRDFPNCRGAQIGLSPAGPGLREKARPQEAPYRGRLEKIPWEGCAVVGLSPHVGER